MSLRSITEIVSRIHTPKKNTQIKEIEVANPTPTKATRSKAYEYPDKQIDQVLIDITTNLKHNITYATIVNDINVKQLQRLYKDPALREKSRKGNY